MNKEMLFEALSDVGDDLLVMAENKRFVSPWRKWGQLAAVLAVVICLGALALPYLTDGSSTAETTSAPMEKMETATEEYCEHEEEAFVTDTTENDYAEIMESEPQEAEEAAPESSVGQGEKRKDDDVRRYTKILCRGTYFYLEDVSQDMGVPPLGEELGTITGSEDLSLNGCRVFTVPYSTWFTNHAVNGEPVTQEIYVQTMSGYRYGITANEKIRSRYTIEDVKTALKKDDLRWLGNLFALAIETCGDVEFTTPEELSADELHILFAASTVMNTGVSVDELWFNDKGEYVVPVSEVRWRLDRFLDEYNYDPAGTKEYDPERDAIVYFLDPSAHEAAEVIVKEAKILEGNRLWMKISRPDRAGLTKEYVIRFDNDSWRYESISRFIPD